MAKLILSNNKDYINKIIKKNVAAGYHSFTRFRSKGFELVAFEKKKRPVKNLYCYENGDFIGTAGTLFFNEKIGEDALRKLHKDFSGDVQEFRNSIIGNFLLVVFKEGKLYVFTDTYQVLKSYYSIDEGNWAIGNALDDVALINQSLEIDYEELAIESLMVSSFGEETMIRNVKKIMGYQHLLYANEKLNVYKDAFSKTNFDLSGLNKVEIAEKYAALAKKYFDIIAKNFKSSIAIHQTGGLDNRTILAGFLGAKEKPRMLYGVGNSALTNTRNEDLEICRDYENQLGLELTVMDWSDELDNTRSKWYELFKKQGFYYSIYGSSSGFLSSYEDCLDDFPSFMECGYFLENLRLREFAEDMNDAITLEQFVDNYLLNGSYGITKQLKLKNFTNVRDKIISDYRKLIDIYQIDITTGITRDNFDEVRWIHARHTDSVMVNFLNQYTCSMAIFSQKDLHEFPFHVESRYRAKAMFQLQLIDVLYPKLLTFPFFTHAQMHKLDKENFLLINTEEMLFKNRLKATIKLLLPTWLLNRLRSYRNRVLASEKHNAITKILLEVFRNSNEAGQVIDSRNIDAVSTVYLMILAQNIKSIEYLKKDKDID